MNKKLIVSNWKTNPQTLAEAVEILESADDYVGSLDEKELSLVFCPPFIFAEEVGKILRTSHLEHQAELGVQNISAYDSATLTGEISGPMLKNLGVRYVIVGHSERRWKLEESDEIVNLKLKAVLRNEMVPIVCIGEKVRDGNFKNFIKNQVEASLADLSANEVARCIIVYEPVWAISTTLDARPDTPESALKSIGVIKEILNTKYSILNTYLYGGSVTSRNIRDFLENEGFDGVLVGGASTNKEEFIKILSIAAKI